MTNKSSWHPTKSRCAQARPLLAAAIATALFPAVQHAEAAEFDEALAVVSRASATSGATDEIRSAWKRLASADADAIPTIIREFDPANPAAENWLRAAVDAIAEQTLAAGDELPKAKLIELVNDTQQSPHGRRVAYEWIARVDPDKAKSMLPSMLNDPSLELRYDAVATGLETADVATGEAKKLAYQKLLNSARDLDQLKTCKAALEELGEEIDLAEQMGFVTSWRVIGPFDNSEQSGFDVVYPPEKEIDLNASYQGKEEEISWLNDPVITDDELGVIDVAEALGPIKGAVAYAYTEYQSPKQTQAFIRYASKNATKLWLNGQEVAANEVYHAGGKVDQYAVPVKLKEGVNTILLKVCQNEQTQPWAQDWQFQLRVTDELAGALKRN